MDKVVMTYFNRDYLMVNNHLAHKAGWFEFAAAMGRKGKSILVF